MDVEAAKYEKRDDDQIEKERLKLIGIIMGSYIGMLPEDKYGDKFDELYAKDIDILRIYSRAFK